MYPRVCLPYGPFVEHFVGLSFAHFTNWSSSPVFPMTRRGSFIGNPFLLVAMIAKVRGDPHGKNKELFMCLTKRSIPLGSITLKWWPLFAAVAIWVKSMCYNGDNFKGGVLCFPKCFSTQYPCLAAFWLSTGNFEIWKCEKWTDFGGFQLPELGK